jgi:hypothetical protein
MSIKTKIINKSIDKKMIRRIIIKMSRNQVEIILLVKRKRIISIEDQSKNNIKRMNSSK